MPAPTITPLPAAPLRSQNPATFAAQAETFVDALEDLPTEINAFAAYLDSLGLDPADIPSAATDLTMATARLLGRTTAGSGAVEELTAAQVRAFLSLVTGTDVQAYSTKLAAIAANTVSSQTGTSYTAVLGDADTYIRFSNASAVSFTIPPNSSVAFPVGTVIEVEQAGAGALSLVAGSGVTLNSRSSDLTLAGQYAVAFAKKVATDTWTVNGDL